MGTLDEHWCSVCKRKLDKKKDKYVEFELINVPFKAKLKGKKQKGIICEKCVNANSELKKAIDVMIKAGNPLFKPAIRCLSHAECETFEPARDTRINCKHIAVIRDKVYCNRSHVGALTLPREKAEVRREEAQIMMKTLERYVKDPQVRKLLKTQFLAKDFFHFHLAASSVVEKANGKVEA